MKTKLIKKPQFNTIDKLSNIFNLEKPIDFLCKKLIFIYNN